jgi:hypothetical protein
MGFTLWNYFSLTAQMDRTGIIIPVGQMKKLKLKKIKSLSKSRN